MRYSRFSSELPPPQPRTREPTKPTSKRRPVPAMVPLPPAKRQRRMAPPIIIPSTSSPPSTAPSSPIDDFSTTIAAQPTMLELNNPPSRGLKSSLLLDVQSRVAKFKVSKAGKGKGKSNRVVNLHEGEGEQSREPDGPGDTTSVIFVDSQEDYSAPIQPVASTSRLPPKKTFSRPVVAVKSATVGHKKATKPPPDPKKATNKALKMTYADYVNQQVKEWTENPLPKEKIHAQCLKDLVVYYCSGNKNSVSPGTQIRVNFVSPLRSYTKVTQLKYAIDAATWSYSSP